MLPPSGRAHYRLLAYISELYNEEVLFDVGTNAARSAIALTYSGKNKIKTYDVLQVLEQNPSLENVEYVIGDSTKDKELDISPFIILDVNHDGSYENYFYNHLKAIKWNGILLLDDIHLNESMKMFWSSIVEEKKDITNLGSWSGTGIVLFD